MEQLETERSERSLVQGALDIARESRLALQRQHELLKKSVRRGLAPEDSEIAQGTTVPGEDSNVRPFPGSGRGN
jgi:crescentin